MQRKMKNSASCVLFIIFLLLALTACTRKWYLAIDESNGSNPILCFSSMDHCIGDGVQFYSLVISEVNEKGKEVQPIWSIQGKSDRSDDYVIKRLTYGVVPKGWIELQPPMEIKTNTFYGVDGGLYFIKLPNGTYQIFQREAFFKQLH